MFKTFINAWKVKDIRTKMLYTLLLIVVYRLGSFIPIPGVNAQALAANIANYDLLGFLNLFSGGSLSQFSLFAMGISPYITGSIIVQLLTIAIPALEKLSKEEDGRQKIERITRYVGIGLAAVQSLTIIVTLQNMSSTSILNTLKLFKSDSANLVITYITIAICCTAGTAPSEVIKAIDKAVTDAQLKKLHMERRHVQWTKIGMPGIGTAKKLIREYYGG